MKPTPLQIAERALESVLEDFIKATCGLPGEHMVACLKHSYIKLAKDHFKKQAKERLCRKK